MLTPQKGSRKSYILHVSREAFGRGGDGVLHLPQQVLLGFWTGHILLHHQVGEAPADGHAGSRDQVNASVKRPAGGVRPHLSKALTGTFFQVMLCFSMSLENEGRLNSDCRMAFM